MGTAKGGCVRARNILQHSVEWMKNDAFRSEVENAGEVAVKMWRNTVTLASGADVVDLGYSQD